LIAVHGLSNKLLVQAATRILPRSLVRSIVHAQQAK